jgi:hypothetical protein
MGLSKTDVHFMITKVPISTCRCRTNSVYYEYAEKWICNISGDAAIQRMQVSKDIKANSKSVMDG